MSNQSATYHLYLNSNVRQSLMQTEQAAVSLDNVMLKLRSTLWSIGVSFGTMTVVNWAKDIIDVTAKFETLDNVIKFSSANISDYKNNVDFLSKSIDNLKLPIFSTIDAYAKFSAALIGTPLQGQQTRDIFEGVSIAARVMHMDEQAVGRVFLALEQMVSKGKVMAEELRRQLGNALPGGFRLFAESLGLSQGELMAKMKKGEVMAEDSLPKFAEHLKNMFSGGIPAAIQSIQAAQVDLNNEWLKTKQIVGDTLRPEIIELLSDLREVVLWVKENRHELIEWGKFIVKIGEYWIAYKVIITGLQTALKGYQAIQYIVNGQMVTQVSRTQAQTAAYASQVTAINSVTAAIERLNFVQNASNASFITTASGATVANTAANRYMISQKQAALAGSSAATAAGATVASSTALSRFAAMSIPVLNVATIILGYAAAKSIFDWMGWRDDFKQADSEGKLKMKMDDVLNDAKFTNSVVGEVFSSLSSGIFEEKIKRLVSEHPDVVGNQEFANALRRQADISEYSDYYTEFLKELGFYKDGERLTVIKNSKDNFFQTINDALGIVNPFEINMPSAPFYPTPDGKPIPRSAFERVQNNKSNLQSKISKTSQVKGNSVTNIHITIGEMNGSKDAKFTINGKMDLEEVKQMVGTQMTTVLTGVVNDSQLVGKHS